MLSTLKGSAIYFNVCFEGNMAENVYSKDGIKMGRDGFKASGWQSVSTPTYLSSERGTNLQTTTQKMYKYRKVL